MTLPHLPAFLSHKVVAIPEMKRIEMLAIQSGCTEEAFIEKAGSSVAACALEFIAKHHLPKNAVLLVGQGNKGADAYAAGIALLEEGIRVRAILCVPPAKCNPLNRLFAERFVKKKGKIEEGELFHFEEEFIIDGLLGTGFKGKIEGNIALAIQSANASKCPILSIDIPSGIDGTTGEMRGCAIQAEETIALGFIKIGVFLREGWNHTGHLKIKDFGLPSNLVSLAEEIAYVPDPSQLLLPEIIRNRHKYQAGYVIGLGGSKIMRGAPKLAGLAALRAGAGIVRLFHKEELGEAPFELICQKWNVNQWNQELDRANAIFIGPGLQKKTISLKNIHLPIVLDADILQSNMYIPSQAILTPHRGEMLRLLGLLKMPQEEEFLTQCEKFAQKKKTVIVLKGAPTWVFGYQRPPIIIPRGDPGMATAGTGDVLTGILAALLAQKLNCYEAAATGAYLHAIAGEKAAKEKTSCGMIASDLIEYFPYAFKKLSLLRTAFK